MLGFLLFLKIIKSKNYYENYVQLKLFPVTKLPLVTWNVRWLLLSIFSGIDTYVNTVKTTTTTTTTTNNKNLKK